MGKDNISKGKDKGAVIGKSSTGKDVIKAKPIAPAYKDASKINSGGGNVLNNSGGYVPREKDVRNISNYVSGAGMVNKKYKKKLVSNAETYKKGAKNVKVQKAYYGVKSVDADSLLQKEGSQKEMVNTIAGSAVNSFVPGLGTALTLGDGIANKMAKGENGVYKSKGAQLANTFLNPMEHLNSGVKAWGKVFEGDFKGAGKALIGDQSELKESIARDKMVNGASKYTSRLTGVDETVAQGVQAKNGKKNVKSKPILIEGGEPVFSAPGKGGKRELLYHNPNKKLSHASGNDIPIEAPEGAAIVTNNNGKSNKAISAYKKGDSKKLNKIISTLPEDKGKGKYNDGTNKLGSDTVDNIKDRQNFYNSKYNAKLKVDGDLGPLTKGFDDKYMNSYLKPRGGYAGFNATESELKALNTKGSINGTVESRTMDAVNKGWDSRVNAKKALDKGITSSKVNASKGAGTTPTTPASGGNSLLDGAMKAAPTIYNMARGLGKSEQVKRRYHTPTMEKISDYSKPAIQAANESNMVNNSNARNLSGGNAGAMRSNLTSNYNSAAKAKSEIHGRETMRKTDILNRNAARQDDSNKLNLQLDNQYDDIQSRNDAARDNSLGKSMTGMSDITQHNELMKNQKENTEAMKKLIEVGRNYRSDGSYKQKGEYKKGVKSVKVYNSKKKPKTK